MYSKDVMVQNQVGLHARPATFFIQKANEFRSFYLDRKGRTSCKRKEPAGHFVLGNHWRYTDQDYC